MESNKPKPQDDLMFRTMPKGLGRHHLIPRVFKPSPMPAPPQSLDTTGKVKKAVILSSTVILVALIGLGILYFWQKDKKENEGTNVNQVNKVVSKIDPSWLQKYFNVQTCVELTVCGDDVDPDHDGLVNLKEFELKSDPNNRDSDTDGLADGDEAYIFGTDPLSSHTGNNIKFSDSDDAKVAWNTIQRRKYTSEELAEIGERVKKSGFHQPTITTLGETLVNNYMNAKQEPVPEGNAPSTDPEALDRDTQRSDAITKISFALLQYKEANKNFPNTTDFNTMINAIKPLLSTGVAVNTNDPKNTPPYVYSYVPVKNATDFKLTYYSETQGQAISLTAAEAQKVYLLDQQNQRDQVRKADLEQLATALELYASDNADPLKPDETIFPRQTEWKTELAPKYIASIPKDPKTKADYSYTVSVDRTSYALQAILENPPTGKKGYLCTQENCVLY